MSPLILDQSFPRNRNELRTAGIALGELAESARRGEAILAITNVLEEFVSGFDWARGGAEHALLSEIYRLISDWLLQPHSNQVKLDLSAVDQYVPHLLPVNCDGAGLAFYWQDELGRLLEAHDSNAGVRPKFCGGVVCDSSFSGGPRGQYRGAPQRSFPLVGRDDLDTLEDAYEWQVDDDVSRRKVSVSMAMKNCSILGASRVDKPNGGSHYRVVFPGERSWPLDVNVDPIPAKFLKELVPIAHLPYLVIRSVLLNGALPQRRFRLANFVAR